MQMLKERLWAMVACSLTTVQAAQADILAQALVNGQVWEVTLHTGPTIGMEFLPDGTVDVHRFLAPDLQWFATEDGLCIDGGPGGRRCARLVPSDNGFVGVDGDTTILTLNR